MLASTNLTNWLRFCGSAAIRYALLSALRTTFPARRPQTEADCPQLQTGSQMRQSAIDAFRMHGGPQEFVALAARMRTMNLPRLKADRSGARQALQCLCVGEKRTVVADFG